MGKRTSLKSINPDEYIPKQQIDKQRAEFRESCKGELFDLQLNNFLWNIGTIQTRRPPGILGFYKAFKKYPAVVVGAGPSLDKTAPLLRQYRRNIIIVACDAALQALVKKHDVYPHFVTMVDPTAKQVKNFEDIDTTKFITIVPPIVTPEIFRKVDPKHLAIYNLKDPTNALFTMAPYHTGRVGALPAAVLSTGAAYAFAGAMWCDPIMFVGQDLSWPNTDKVYADGTSQWKVNYQKGSKFRGGCMLFPDIHGRLVLTHQSLWLFREWLKDTTNVCAQNVINCSGAGILNFKGLKIIDFDKALTKYAPKELTGLDEQITKALNARISDGLVEIMLAPPFKKEHSELRERVTGEKGGK